MLWVLGARFARGHAARGGSRPGSTWLFRPIDDPELERIRRTALLILPFLVVAAVVYVLTSGAPT